MNSRVRIDKDPTHQEYKVAGINWDNEDLLLMGDEGNFWCNHKLVSIIPDDDWD